MASTLDPVAPPRAGRIVGLDIARALAMLGMVIVHYVWSDETGEFLDTVALAMVGRAMPLFMMLGGVGVVLTTRRSQTPDRDLLIRAAMLFLLGLVVHELTARIAIVLQSYGLLFAMAPLFRRLPRPALLGGAAVTTAVGAVTYQLIDWPPAFTRFEDLFTPGPLVESLFIDGYYPFFPVAAFFLFGMWLGGVDLRSDRVAASLAVGGAVVGFGSLWLANGAASLLELELSRSDADQRFEWSALLNAEGHSEMPAWVLSAGGTSAMVIGLSLLVGARVGRWLHPVAALGRLALTFYVFQALVIHLTPEPTGTEPPEEFGYVALIYFGFMAFAVGWTSLFRSGPLESLLRVGSGPRIGAGDRSGPAVGMGHVLELPPQQHQQHR
ncbi:MAG: heparan-alpha-glucosaminide N-acetyltransferase domain-containing protein [Actinomycetota bacterium]